MNTKGQKQKLNLTIKKSTIWAFLSVFFYKIVLDVSYNFIISPVWSCAKFDLNLNTLKLIESFFLLFVIFISMPKSKKKLSNVMVWILVLISYIPMLTLFALMDQPRVYMYAVTGFWMWVFLLLKLPVVSLLPLRKSQSKIISYLIFFSLIFAVFLLIYRYFGISFNFDFTKVYEIRKIYTEMKIPLAGYFFTWTAYAVNPIFFALLLTRRKWIFVVLIVVLQLLLFSSTGSKSFLFVLPFVLVLMWIMTHKNPLFYFSIGLTGIIILGMFSYSLVDDVWICSLSARRTLLVPAQLSFFYYDFFQEHGQIFLSQHRIFRNFLDYPYHLPSPYLIGEVYFNRPEMSANTGLVGDAYMNFGFIGFILWGILLVTILKLIDSFSKNKDAKITIAAIAMPTIFLINSALLTCLLTHGLLLALILLFLLPKNQIIKA